MAKGHFYTLGFNSQWDIPSCRCWHILIWFWLMSPIHDLAFFLVQTELKKSQLLLTNGHFYTSGHSILLPLTPSYLFLIDVLPAPATPVQPPPSYKSVAGIAMLELWCYWENTKQIHTYMYDSKSFHLQLRLLIWDFSQLCDVWEGQELLCQNKASQHHIQG